MFYIFLLFPFPEPDLGGRAIGVTQQGITDALAGGSPRGANTYRRPAFCNFGKSPVAYGMMGWGAAGPLRVNKALLQDSSQN